MDVRDRQVALARAGVEAAKHKILRAGNFAQGQVLRRRADKDHVVVLHIVERKQTAALDPNLPVQQTKSAVESMHRQHFSHSGVVVQNGIARVAGGIEVAHAGFRPPHERAVAENHPGLFRSDHKSFPESGKCGRGRLSSHRLLGERRSGSPEAAQWSRPRRQAARTELPAPWATVAALFFFRLRLSPGRARSRGAP